MENGSLEGIPYTPVRDFTKVPPVYERAGPNSGQGLGYREWETEFP